MRGTDIEALERALATGQLVLPPAVVAELLSLFDSPDSEAAHYLLAVPLLPILDGYWHRVGMLRAALRQHGRRARLADSMICQSCVDHDVALITRDPDFRSHARHVGLKLA